MNKETIPCRLCNKPTKMLGTKLCDECWELESRIHNQPQLAQKVLDQMNIEQKRFLRMVHDLVIEPSEDNQTALMNYCSTKGDMGNNYARLFAVAVTDIAGAISND